MWLVALALASGVAVGVISRPSNRVGIANRWIARVGLTLLLVNMGAKLASDPRIRMDMARTGTSAAALALSSVIGSILFVHLLTYLGLARRGRGGRLPKAPGVGDTNPERGEAL